MTAPARECQPEAAALRQHTSTPWHADETAIFAQDGVLARIPNHPENGKNWSADAAFIVEAVNNHERLLERVKYLEASEAKQIAEFRRALTLLWKETVESGNSTANDYGWPAARKATLSALSLERSGGAT